MEQKPVTPEDSQKAIRFAFRVGLAANALTFVVCLYADSIAVDPKVRRALPALCAFVLTFVALGCLPFKAPLFQQGRPVYLLWLAFVLSVTPVILAAVVLHHPG